MTYQVQVDAETFDHMLVWSFRYGLGRRSAAVSTIADLLIQHRYRLSEFSRGQIVRDIELAIESGQAGMDCDVADWRRVAEALT